MAKDFKSIIIENLTILKKKEIINNEPYKVKAYEKVISQLEEFPGPIYSMKDIEDAGFSGIGKKTKAKLEEIFDTGKLVAAEKAKTEEDGSINLYDDLLEIFGVGPVKAKELIDTYGVESIQDLREKVEVNPDLLTKASKIGLQHYEDFRERIPRNEMELHDTVIHSFLPDGIYAEITGSYRRGLATSGDIDVILTVPPKKRSKRVDSTSDNNVKDRILFLEFLEELGKQGYITDILSLGPAKCLAVCKIEDKYRRIDFMLTPHEEFYYALLYFTGSKQFNVAMRGYVLQMGWSLSEHLPVREGAIGPAPPIPTSERDIFDFFGLKYVEPKDRRSFEDVQKV
jgi:DNA polymerase/3'-5' exonuclease PolX